MEENQPPPRRPRSPRPPFRTPDQQEPSSPPARKPPATPPPITFRPPGTTVDRGRRTATDNPTAESSTQVHGSAPTPPPAKAQPPARRGRGGQQPAKRTPSGAVEATPSGAGEASATAGEAGEATATSRDVAKAATPPKAVTNTTPAKKAAAKKASAAKKTAAAKATPPAAEPQDAPAEPTPAKKQTVPAKQEAAPAKKAAAAKASPLKHTLKAAAAEIAPAVVEPDMTTVPDEPAPENGRPDAGPASTAASAETPATTGAGAEVPATTGASSDGPERTDAWARLIADPGHSPELLALAAVQTLGPQAQEWAERMRDAYPNATPDGIARLASQQFVRFGTVSSVFAAVAGSYAPLTLLGTAALAHAELSLHVAAAYGLDPTDPARAVDLLLLTRVHPSREDAEAALAASREHSYEGAGVTDAAWRLGRMVAVQAGGWMALRAANRFFPGTSLLAAVLTSRAAAQTVAARANLFYRGAAG